MCLFGWQRTLQTHGLQLAPASTANSSPSLRSPDFVMSVHAGEGVTAQHRGYFLCASEQGMAPDGWLFLWALHTGSASLIGPGAPYQP